MEIAAAEAGQGDEPLPKRSLRAIARNLLDRAMDNDAAQREVADRLDGKPIGVLPVDEDGNPIARLSDSDIMSELTRIAEETGVEIHVGIRRGKKQKLINGG